MLVDLENVVQLIYRKTTSASQDGSSAVLGQNEYITTAGARTLELGCIYTRVDILGGIS